MKLSDVIEYLRHPDKLGQLYETLNLSTNSEAILIYMKDSLNLDSELRFFEIERTEDDLIFKENGVTYHQLFPVHYAAKIIDSYFSDNEKGLDNVGLAKRLLEYRINDA
jgi:hypothetical protein